MKKKIIVEVEACDICGSGDDLVYACESCGKSICYKCRPRFAVKYPHSVYCSGSGDGFYCNDCDSKLRRSGTDKRHSALLVIEALRKEWAEWSEEFTKRRKVAEATVENLRKP